MNDSKSKLPSANGAPGAGATESRQERGESFLDRDRRLLLAWQQGDQEKGLELFRHYHDYFRALCWRFGIRSEDGQAELYQEMVLRFLKFLDEIRLESSFAGYVRKVVISILRAREERPDPLPLEDSPGATGTPQEELLKSEFWKAVILCEMQLTPREERVFTGRIFEELTFSDLASELAVSSSNLYVIYHRARRKMRDCLLGKGISLAI